MFLLWKAVGDSRRFEASCSCSRGCKAVYSVLKSLCGMPILKDICWSHTMKELGSLVTFVRRNSVPKVTLRNTCSDVEMWSRIFAMNVQKVSIEHLNWNGINQFTLTTDSFAASCATHSSRVNTRSRDTWRSVLQYTISAPFCFDYEQSGWSTTDDISWQKFNISIVFGCLLTVL